MFLFILDHKSNNMLHKKRLTQYPFPERNQQPPNYCWSSVKKNEARGISPANISAVKELQCKHTLKTRVWKAQRGDFSCTAALHGLCSHIIGGSSAYDYIILSEKSSNPMSPLVNYTVTTALLLCSSPLNSILITDISPFPGTE